MTTRLKLATYAAVAVLGTLCLLSSPAVSAEQDTAPTVTNQVSPDTATYTVLSGITYASPDGSPLLADIYEPKGPGPFPGIVFIHGGGWRGGDRNQLRRQAQYMAERGMVGMAIEYRLAPAHPFPAALDDAKAAVAWFRAHADQYHLDPTKVAAVGSSAGAHLSAMLGTQSSNTLSAVQAVVAFNGIFDFEAMPPSVMVSDFLGASCANGVAVCKEASPIDRVHPHEPPFLVLHGTADKTAPFSQAQAFVDKMRASGNHVEIFVAQDAPHTFWAQPKWLAPSFAAMSQFLAKTFGTSVH